MNERVYLRNFRAFSEPKPIPLSQVNILVGENSSGKSAFLAAYRIAHDIANGFPRPDFNEEPFELGSYDQIAHYRGGRSGRRRFFEIGLDLPTNSFTDQENIIGVKLGQFFRKTATFRAGQFEPVISSVEYQTGNISLILEGMDNNNDWSIRFRSGSSGLNTNLREFIPEFLDKLNLASLTMGTILALMSSDFVDKGPDDIQFTNASEKKAWQSFLQFVNILKDYEQTRYERPIAFGPVRMKPSRTYNPLTEQPDPEGGHIPMTLARIASSSQNEWKDIIVPLEKFARAAGLFQHLKIRKFGKKWADPFQIQVQVMGQPANIVDVGYGVSQILPFLVEALRCRPGATLMLQQPEVHLHPRAQAELGTFIRSLCRSKKIRVILETHSDYLIDRLKYEVSAPENDFAADDLNILFFEKGAHDAKIHPIKVDNEGNVVDPPRSYRQFFLEETNRILGI